MAFTRLLLFKHWFINAYKHLAVNEDRQKKIKSRKLTIYVVMISFSIANLFLPVLKTIKSVLPIPFCFRIICYVYRISTLVLPSESRAIDFLKLFGIVIYLRFKKKIFFLYILFYVWNFVITQKKSNLSSTIVTHLLGNDCFCFCEQ